MRLLAIGFSGLLLSACASEPLKPWHRDILAQPHMQLGGDSMHSKVDKKMYFSREASRGASGLGGGGCGCN
jgi:hypothetical protein